jgi:hypothetical protein
MINQNLITFTLNINFRTLVYDLGCFPFDIKPSRHMSDCLYLKYKFILIQSFTGFKEIFIFPIDL